MYEIKPISEIQPSCRLIVDEKPPIGKDVWLISKYGHGYRGRWDKDDDSIVAWAPLPRLTSDQKETIRRQYGTI
jgi:hypothetical protein